MAEVKGKDAVDAPAGNAPVLPKRREAVGCGWGCGTFAVAVLVGIAAFVADEGSLPVWLVVLGALASAGGLVLRGQASVEDRAALRRERPPHLPIALAAEGEPVWITADVDCPRPILAPHFHVRCAWLHVRTFEGQGKQRRVSCDDRSAARVWLVDPSGEGTGRVELDLAKVSLSQIPSWTVVNGTRTTTIRFLPAEGRLSACGVVRRERRTVPPPATDLSNRPRPLPAPPGATVSDAEDAEERRVPPHEPGDPLAPPPPPEDAEEALVLRGEEDLPLLVTPLARSAWTQRAETEELRTRTIGTSLFFCGTAVAAAAALALAGVTDLESADAWLDGVAAACVVAGPWIAWATLRRVRETRSRAEEAAAALESDLARAARDPDGAGVRVAARLAVYDQLATEHNDLLRVPPMAWIAGLTRQEPLPLHGDGGVPRKKLRPPLSSR